MRLVVILMMLVVPLVSGQAFCPDPHKAPPRRKGVIIKPAKPYRQAVWLSGHWKWRKARYVWVVGHWVKPRRGYVWVDGHWARRGGRWICVAGHWKRIRP